MFHHHFITRDTKELIYKVYLKQKEDSLKSDWYQTLKKEFEFIGEDMDDDRIRKIPKGIYKKFIQKKVEKASFLTYQEEKEKSKKKMHQLKYNSLHIQCYMTDSSFTHNEIKLLFSLRSNCYPAKMNFKKMYKGDLKCFFLCDEEETQVHIFENCQPIRRKLKVHTDSKISSIYGTLSEQKEALSAFLLIDSIRKIMINEILPGRSVARTPVFSLY